MSDQRIEERPPAVARPARTARPGWLTALLAGVALLLVYGALSFLNDPNGTLSTDVGGKIATLRAMDTNGTTTPDVGYWAAEWDPSAELHGLFFTSRAGDDAFVNVTTVPVIELARPLYAVAGARGALLWSMLGAVAAAFAARALARRSGADERRGWLAFGLTGLASPVLLYALDLWEHAPGLGLMAWGVVAMLDTAAGRTRWAALAAGAAFGAAFSMRTEAVVYGFVVVALGCLLLWRRRGLFRALVAGALAATGFLVLAAANTALEAAVIGSSVRAGRASGTASSGGSDLGIRLREAVTTTVGVLPSDATGPLLVGLVGVGLLGWGVWRSTSGRGDPNLARLAAIGAVAVFLVRGTQGLGFVPGFLATAPFGVVALVLVGQRRLNRFGTDAVLMAVAALPLVWLFQYSGGAVPQWGGRYVLTSGLVLAAVGIAGAGQLERWLQTVLVGLTVGVAVFGLAWMSVRTHEIARMADTVEAIDGPIVSTRAFWLRELGAVYQEDSQWLSLRTMADLPDATSVLDQAGERSFELLWVPESPQEAPPAVDGWTPTGAGRADRALGLDFRLTPYVRD